MYIYHTRPIYMYMYVYTCTCTCTVCVKSCQHIARNEKESKMKDLSFYGSNVLTNFWRVLYIPELQPSQEWQRRVSQCSAQRLPECGQGEL